MNTKPQPPAPRTAAEINKAMQVIGEELAKGRLTPVANARQLEAEQRRLQGEYREALERESEAARDAAEIQARVEAARRSAHEAEREKRISAAVAEQLGP